jgi:hypothetical protein
LAASCSPQWQRRLASVSALSGQPSSREHRLTVGHTGARLLAWRDAAIASRYSVHGSNNQATPMKRPFTIAFTCVLALQISPALAEEAQVTWIDSNCQYFVVKLPESDESEKFGLFSATVPPMPKTGDQLKGSMTAIETQLENLTTGEIHNVIHWAVAKSQEQLVHQASEKCTGAPDKQH